MKPTQVNFTRTDLTTMLQRRIDTMKAPNVDPLANMKAAIQKTVKV